MPAFSKIHSDGADPEDSPLETRNIEITDRKNNKLVRTSMRLEPYVWDALYDVAEREGRTYHEICDMISFRKHPASSLTAAVRLFILVYFRIAADEKGHAEAGHGTGDSGLFERIIAKMNQPPDAADRRKPPGRRKRASPADTMGSAVSESAPPGTPSNGRASNGRASAATLAGAGRGRKRAKAAAEGRADGPKD